MPSRFQVVTCLSNPFSFNSRNILYERFVDHMTNTGADLTVVELIYDDRITRADKREDRIWELRQEQRELKLNFIPLRTRDVLWHKEQLINIAFESLPDDWKYAVWADADIHFANPMWAKETIAALNHYDIVQPWSHAIDLCPRYAPVPNTKIATSFMYGWRNSLPSKTGRYDDWNHHPGYAWGIRREAYEELGGLLDTAILGAGDRHMAMGLVGKAALSYPSQVSDGYKASVLAWQNLADRYIAGNVGYVDGLITHGWHGSKKKRRYHDRWKILIEHQFDPVTDLRIDRGQDIWRWADDRGDRMRGLRDDVRGYFSARDEDSGPDWE